MDARDKHAREKKKITRALVLFISSRETDDSSNDGDSRMDAAKGAQLASEGKQESLCPAERLMEGLDGKRECRVSCLV